jgi:hypothetical protein
MAGSRRNRTIRVVGDLAVRVGAGGGFTLGLLAALQGHPRSAPCPKDELCVGEQISAAVWGVFGPAFAGARRARGQPAGGIAPAAVADQARRTADVTGAPGDGPLDPRPLHGPLPSLLGRRGTRRPRVPRGGSAGSDLRGLRGLVAHWGTFRRRHGGLAVLPSDLVNAVDGWPVAE